MAKLPTLEVWIKGNRTIINLADFDIRLHEREPPPEIDVSASLANESKSRRRKKSQVEEV